MRTGGSETARDTPITETAFIDTSIVAIILGLIPIVELMLIDLGTQENLKF